MKRLIKQVHGKIKKLNPVSTIFQSFKTNNVDLVFGEIILTANGPKPKSHPMLQDHLSELDFKPEKHNALAESLLKQLMSETDTKERYEISEMLIASIEQSLRPTQMHASNLFADIEAIQPKRDSSKAPQPLIIPDKYQKLDSDAMFDLYMQSMHTLTDYQQRFDSFYITQANLRLAITKCVHYDEEGFEMVKDIISGRFNIEDNCFDNKRKEDRQMNKRIELA